jgi:natural product precursor
MKKGQRKLTLSKETLRTLDEKELSRIVGGDASGSHVGNKCPNSKVPNDNGCKG